MLAPVFFVLLFGIIEVGVIFYGTSVLEKATQDAARLVRTGQAQASTLTQEQFRTRICDEIAPVLACDANLQIDVRSYASFGGASFAPPVDADGNLDPSLDAYEPGNAGDVVLVRSFYTWDVLTPLLAPLISNMSGGRRLIAATAAFRNEPFVN